MMRNVGGILAAASVAVGLWGCAEEPAPAIGPCVYPELTRAAIATVGEPGPADLPFGEALITYSRQIGRLHAGGEHTDAHLRRAVQKLATVLDRIPAGAAEPRLRRAAGLMSAAMEGPEPSTEETKRALAVGATALLELADRAYRDVPDVAERARAFAGAVTAVDGERDDQAGLINALLLAERALATMYAADLVPQQR